MDGLLDWRAARLERAAGLLTALSYHGVLARGFALVRDAAGAPLRAAASITPGLALDIEFSDGRVGAMATSQTGAAPPAPVFRRRRRSKISGEGQGSLF
jgi:exodeoxyribonuclease VII large subunit